MTNEKLKEANALKKEIESLDRFWEHSINSRGEMWVLKSKDNKRLKLRTADCGYLYELELNKELAIRITRVVGEYMGELQIKFENL